MIDRIKENASGIVGMTATWGSAALTLTNIREFFATANVLIGFVIGCASLWLMIRNRNRK